MDLKTYTKTLTPEAFDDFARRCGTSSGYLRNLLNPTYRLCGPRLAVKIEEESGGLVTRRELRPKDWQQVWPELAGAH